MPCNTFLVIERERKKREVTAEWFFYFFIRQAQKPVKQERVKPKKSSKSSQLSSSSSWSSSLPTTTTILVRSFGLPTTQSMFSIILLFTLTNWLHDLLCGGVWAKEYLLRTVRRPMAKENDDDGRLYWISYHFLRKTTGSRILKGSKNFYTHIAQYYINPLIRCIHHTVYMCEYKCIFFPLHTIFQFSSIILA